MISLFSELISSIPKAILISSFSFENLYKILSFCGVPQSVGELQPRLKFTFTVKLNLIQGTHFSLIRVPTFLFVSANQNFNKSKTSFCWNV